MPRKTKTKATSKKTATELRLEQKFYIDEHLKGKSKEAQQEVLEVIAQSLELPLEIIQAYVATLKKQTKIKRAEHFMMTSELSTQADEDAKKQTGNSLFEGKLKGCVSKINPDEPCF